MIEKFRIYDKIGLRSIFTLLKESRSIEPTLCTKALAAVLDVLQGQLPESLRSEPAQAIGMLFINNCE